MMKRQSNKIEFRDLAMACWALFNQFKGTRHGDIGWPEAMTRKFCASREYSQGVLRRKRIC